MAMRRAVSCGRQARHLGEGPLSDVPVPPTWVGSNTFEGRILSSKPFRLF